MSAVTYTPQEFEYGLSRVKNTVIMRKDGEPYLITDGDAENKHLYGFPLKEGIQGYSKCLEVGFEGFLLDPVPLGYTNCKKTRASSYITRTPTRHYKQGLNGTNMRSLNFGVKLVSYSLYKTIIGEYPSKEYAFEQVVCGEWKSCAFCRDFSFSYDGRLSEDTLRLYYRDRPVGIVKYNPQAGVIIHQLNKKYQFLKETLEESWNNV